MKLLEFLETRPIYHKISDNDRIDMIFSKYKKHFQLKPVIHIIGTNGKGSTGRWLALMLQQAGFMVGHFTSPHIREYNERFWLDGKHVSYEVLQAAHKKLNDIILFQDLKLLSYFEYSTLLVSFIFCDCDFIILEAGLGGEFDATNIYDKKLSIITPIGFDHEGYLGYTIKAIAKTKINSINVKSVIAPQNDKVVMEVARYIATKKSIPLVEVKSKFSPFIRQKIRRYLKRNNHAKFLENNFLTAYVAAQELGVKADISTLLPLDLAGRCQKIRDNIYIDVGHNPLSAEVVANQFKKEKVVLIYNSFFDKDIFSVLSILKPIITHVEIIKFYSPIRKTGEDKIIKTLNSINVSWSYFEGKIDEEKKYLVFGSFCVVDEFLKKLNEG